MGVLNIVWIVLFLVLGAGLTFQAFEAINFFIWDNLFGIAVILVGLFGIYCMTKDTVPFVRRLSEKLEPHRHAPEAGRTSFSTGGHGTDEDSGKSRRISVRGSRAQQDKPEKRIHHSGGMQAGNRRESPGRPGAARGEAAGSVPAKSSAPETKPVEDPNGAYTGDLDRILKEVDTASREKSSPFITTDDIDLNDLLK